MDVCEATPKWQRLLIEHSKRSEALLTNGEGDAILWLPFGKGTLLARLFWATDCFICYK
jgi:hypothetical protein